MSTVVWKLWTQRGQLFWGECVNLKVLISTPLHQKLRLLDLLLQVLPLRCLQPTLKLMRRTVIVTHIASNHLVHFTYSSVVRCVIFSKSLNPRMHFEKLTCIGPCREHHPGPQGTFSLQWEVAFRHSHWTTSSQGHHHQEKRGHTVGGRRPKDV